MSFMPLMRGVLLIPFVSSFILWVKDISIVLRPTFIFHTLMKDIQLAAGPTFVFHTPDERHSIDRRFYFCLSSS